MDKDSKIIFSTPISLEKDVKQKGKKEVKTEKDYKRIAEDTLKAANDIEDIIIVYFKNNPRKFMASEGVSAYMFFAIELYIKSILYKQKKSLIEIRKKHDLLALFELIDVKTRGEIEKLCYGYAPYKNYVDFYFELKHIKDGFEILRYHYEYTGMCYNYSFTLGLLSAVKNIANREIKT